MTFCEQRSFHHTKKTLKSVIMNVLHFDSFFSLQPKCSIIISQTLNFSTSKFRRKKWQQYLTESLFFSFLQNQTFWQLKGVIQYVSLIIAYQAISHLAFLFEILSVFVLPSLTRLFQCPTWPETEVPFIQTDENTKKKNYLKLFMHRQSNELIMNKISRVVHLCMGNLFLSFNFKCTLSTLSNRSCKIFVSGGNENIFPKLNINRVFFFVHLQNIHQLARNCWWTKI